ncbi:GntR family transcriptional regulator [Sulfitobacter alexandrii]|uniref:GntR family transcriptional regulator n=1 Tax=Sulfitobacter alexandrii TaxID=1917485 RepID=A0A1J0WJF1_9RHOB|nr:GntR family transcriptional regulator [Sulfitobacter alexandrii]APE44452.1 GntR family transcriptional regulator [Sulfitobacter alexandrii]
MTLASTVSDDRLPAYLRLRDDIARRIAAGEWKPDEALPSDNRLAAEHALSVGTVRKALQKLSDEGLLERRQGAGTFLRKPAFDATLFRFFQVREHGAEQSIPSSRLISRTQVTATEHVANALGTTEVIRIERLRCLSEQPFLYEEIFIPQARFAGFEAIPAEEIGPLLYPVYYERFGVFVAQAEDVVSFGTADRTIALRLGLTEGDPVAQIERTAFAMTGEAIEWRVASGRADRFHYHSRIG